MTGLNAYIWDLDGTLFDSYGSIVSSLVSLAGGLCLVHPGTVTDLIGVGLIALVVVTNHMANRDKKSATA